MEGKEEKTATATTKSSREVANVVVVRDSKQAGLSGKMMLADPCL